MKVQFDNPSSSVLDLTVFNSKDDYDVMNAVAYVGPLQSKEPMIME